MTLHHNATQSARIAAAVGADHVKIASSDRWALIVSAAFGASHHMVGVARPHWSEDDMSPQEIEDIAIAAIKGNLTVRSPAAYQPHL